MTAHDTPEREAATYRAARSAIIEYLNRALGRDAIVPLTDVATLLPVNPEWARYSGKRRTV